MHRSTCWPSCSLRPSALFSATHRQSARPDSTPSKRCGTSDRVRRAGRIHEVSLWMDSADTGLASAARRPRVAPHAGLWNYNLGCASPALMPSEALAVQVAQSAAARDAAGRPSRLLRSVESEALSPSQIASKVL